MRHEVTFFLNGRRRVVSGRAAFGSLTEYLRDELGLVGTKVGCNEGDCGACTILVGRPDATGTIRYRAATSCILTSCQVDATHLVTVEGLCPRRGDLTPIQAALVEHHGSQCGYCTPGFVMTLTGLFEAEPEPDEPAILAALTGNLCRCTGYLPILAAGQAVARARNYRPLADLYPAAPSAADLIALSRDVLLVEGPENRRFLRTIQLSHANQFLAENSGCVVIAGGTDLGVWRNRGGIDPPCLLSLAALPELGWITRDEDEITIGATVTWADLERFAAVEAPDLLPITDHFAAPAIRQVASVVGNVAGGSPIADLVAVLHILDARLQLSGPEGSRWVAIADFGTGYRQTVRRDDELITRLVVRLPRPDERLGVFKISKRKEMDISTFRAAILVHIAPADGRIDRAAVAFAGVGPTVIRLPATEAFLHGQLPTEATFHAAGAHARAEIEPVSDRRGSRDHRLILAENILLKFFRTQIEPHLGEHSLDR